MIARQFIILVALLLNLNSSLAIKGGKRNLKSRVLQGENTLPESDVFDGSAPKEPPAVDGDGDPLAKKDEKKDKKKDDKKEKKDKKCKKRAPPGDEKGAAKLSGEDPVEIIIVGGETSEDPNENATTPVKPDDSLPGPAVNASNAAAGPPPPPDDEELILWCEDPSIQVLGDCEELEADLFPEQEESVDGILNLEVSSASENLVQEMERVLQEDTSLAAVGCSGRRRLQDNTTYANVTVYLLGVQLGKPSESTEGCAQTEDNNCTIVTSSVVIYYSGNATDDQKKALFDTLTNTILGQIESGDFDSIASVHYAEAKMLSESDEVYSSAKGSSGPPVGAIGGIIGAIALVILIIAGVVYMKRRNEDGCGPAAIVPAERGTVVQVLSDDVEVVRAHVFG